MYPESGQSTELFPSTREMVYFSSGRMMDWIAKPERRMTTYLQALKAVLIRYAGIFAAHIGI